MKLKMAYLDYKIQRILFCCCTGKNLQQIVQSLAEGHIATKASVAKFLICYDKTEIIACAPGRGQKSKVTAEVKQMVEEQMERNDEITESCRSCLARKVMNVHAVSTLFVSHLILCTFCRVTCTFSAVVPYFICREIYKCLFYAGRSILRLYTINFTRVYRSDCPCKYQVALVCTMYLQLNIQSIAQSHNSYFWQLLDLQMGTALHFASPVLLLNCSAEIALGYHSNSSMKWGKAVERGQVADPTY